MSQPSPGPSDLEPVAEQMYVLVSAPRHRSIAHTTSSLAATYTACAMTGTHPSSPIPGCLAHDAQCALTALVAYEFLIVAEDEVVLV